MEWQKYSNKIKSLNEKEIDKVVVDEIFTYVGNKNIKGIEKSKKKNWTYLLTAIIKTKKGKSLPFFGFCSSRDEDNLLKFLEKLPYSKNYYADEAKYFRNCWFRKFIVGKSKNTNIIESFNSYLRSKNACLRRRSSTYAKNLHNYSLRLMINVFDFLQKTI